jgi:putative ABC transport system permease protein
VVGQVATSLVLLIGAGLLIKSVTRLASTELGFDVQRLLTADIQLLETEYPDDRQRMQFFEQLLNEVDSLPGVTTAGFVNQLPIRHPFGNPPAWPADNPPADPADRMTANRRVVLPGYFEAMRMPLVAGRDLAPTDRETTPHVVVVNETLARTFFPEREPLGQRVVIAGSPDRTFEVVGVVADARIDRVDREVRAAAYQSYFQGTRTTMRLVARSTLGLPVLAGTVRRLVEETDPNVLISNVTPMEDLIGDSIVSQQVSAVTLTLFSGVALLLASLGLYGVLAYYVAQRTHEIGVRMAVGAEPGTIVGYVLRRSGRMLVPGLVLGLLGSLVAVRYIEHLLYDVPPTDPTTFVAVTATLAVVALAASAWPAWRASRIDPIQALRGE